jgi:putative membrane protein
MLLRRAALVAGLVTLALVWLGPLPGLASRAFSAHMLMHMGVVAVAAPLLAAGLAASRLDPVGVAPRLLAPIPASFVELIVVWAWHAPALHHAARHGTAALIAEQGTFLGTGVVLWVSALGGAATGRSGRSAAGVVALLLTAMHMTLLGALLALSPRALYGHRAGLAGMSALEDQHLGGAIMLVVGGAAYLLGGLWLTARVLRSAPLASAERT